MVEQINYRLEYIKGSTYNSQEYRLYVDDKPHNVNGVVAWSNLGDFLGVLYSSIAKDVRSSEVIVLSGLESFGSNVSEIQLIEKVVGAI